MGIKFSKSKKAQVDQRDLFYNMNYPKRGTALIFNHVNFDFLEDRTGSHKDCKRITKDFKNLGFETRIYEDLKYLEIEDVLGQVSSEDHSEEDCLVIVIMTHGYTGLLSARDNFYPVNNLWEPFTDNQCPTLAGKPKLFFIQACRGCAIDNGILLTEQKCKNDAIEMNESEIYQECQKHMMIPDSSVPADTLVMYSTVNGYVSFRVPDEGSWFIQDLCAELEHKVDHHTLQDLLVATTRRVADRSTADQGMQIPSTVSRLSRLIFFGKKEMIEN